MKLVELSEVVKLAYNKIYDEKIIKEEMLTEKKFKLTFRKEAIIIDNSVGNKYRITFNDYVGTIDHFRNLFDYILGFNDFCCDTSNFIDLTEGFITKLYKHLHL